MGILSFIGIGWLVVSPVVTLIWGRVCAAALDGAGVDRGR